MSWKMSPYNWKYNIFTYISIPRSFGANYSCCCFNNNESGRYDILKHKLSFYRIGTKTPNAASVWFHGVP